MARVRAGTVRRHSVLPCRVATITRIVALPALVAALVACSSSDATGPGASPSSSTTVPPASATATDYAQPANWLAAPSDPTKTVDVFYLYPTVWNRAQPSDSIIATIDDPKMQQGAAFALETQASAFDGVANVYAPYYRQAGSDVLNMTLQQRNKIINGVPTTDALAAFKYYVNHLNAGRPFILAGHSQGSNLLVNLLSSYLSKHAGVAKRMIVAYVIGYSVTSDYLASNPHLKFATRAGDVGVIVSYNTQSPQTTGKNPVVEPGALVINPVSWTAKRDRSSRAEQPRIDAAPVRRDTHPRERPRRCPGQHEQGRARMQHLQSEHVLEQQPGVPQGRVPPLRLQLLLQQPERQRPDRVDRYLDKH